jgi:predicted PurR-regulated permease PerM
MTNTKRIEQITGFLALGLLVVGCFVVMRPFLSALLWAVVLCFSTWPIHRRLMGWVGNRRTVAAILMTLMISLVLLVPFVLIGFGLADNVKELTTATRKWLDEGPPAPPALVEKIPLVGPQIKTYWLDFTEDSGQLIKDLQRFIEPVSSWMLSAGIKLGGGLLELSLSIFIAFFLFRDGATATEWLNASVGRIAGDHGKHLLTVAGNTVRGVVYGILGTALVQGVVAGIGFAIAGVPGAGLLALLTFFLSVVPMGPPLVWIPATIWLFHQGSTGWGIFMLVWGVLVSSVDNVVKPLIISQGSNMPFVLIFFGVVGGALAFGFIGVFLGPTLLAVTYRLLEEWSAIHKPAATPEPSANPTADPSRDEQPV